MFIIFFYSTSSYITNTIANIIANTIYSDKLSYIQALYT